MNEFDRNILIVNEIYVKILQVSLKKTEALDHKIF